MKKLSLKNLKVLKISDLEKSKITGGSGEPTSAICNAVSVWPVQCNSNQWTCTISPCAVGK